MYFQDNCKKKETVISLAGLLDDEERLKVLATIYGKVSRGETVTIEGEDGRTIDIVPPSSR